MKNLPKRHDLVFLSRNGLQYAWENRAPDSHEADAASEYFFRLPGICRTRPSDLSPALAALGYSFPIRTGETRVRVATQAPVDEIVKIITPWEVPGLLGHLPQPYLGVLTGLVQCAKDEGIQFGMFGSAALQAVTGLPYLHSQSDLDVVIAAAPPEQVRMFYQHLTRISRQSDVRIDGELMLHETCYVKLSELMGGSKTVLAKGADQPALLSSQSIWDTMAAMPQ